MRTGQPRVRAEKAYRPGIHIVDGATEIALNSSARPERHGLVVFCELGPDGTERQYPLDPPAGNDSTWGIRLRRVIPQGRRYGFRACGDDDAAAGARFDPAQLLSDPYARAFTANPLDARRPFAVVVPDGADLPPVAAAPRRALSETVIYEADVQSLSRSHEDVPEAQRGTFAGMASDAVLGPLRQLGFTAIELVAVHQRLDASRLDIAGGPDRPGPPIIGLFAPDFTLSSSGSRGGQVEEFRHLVDAVHRNGLEVILDMANGRTGAEDGPCPHCAVDRPGGPQRHDGPTPRDNGTSQDLPEFDGFAVSTLTDALRYWTEVMGVDGFRLGCSLLATPGDLERTPRRTLEAIAAALPPDVKLFVEPVSIPPGAWPDPWIPWDDRFSDAIHRFWFHDAAAGELRLRLAGSPDLMTAARRTSTSTSTAVTSHDRRSWPEPTPRASEPDGANRGRDRPLPDEIADDRAVDRTTSQGRPASDTQDASALIATTLIASGVPVVLAGALSPSHLVRSVADGNDDGMTGFDRIPTPGRPSLLVQTILAFRAAHPELIHSWTDDDRTWAQSTLGAGTFLGVIARCTGHTHEAAALMINSSTTAIRPRPPRPVDAWQTVWCTSESRSDGPFTVPPRSVIAAYATG